MSVLDGATDSSMSSQGAHVLLFQHIQNGNHSAKKIMHVLNYLGLCKALTRGLCGRQRSARK